MHTNFYKAISNYLVTFNLFNVMKLQQFLFRGLGFLLLLSITRGIFLVDTIKANDNLSSRIIVKEVENNFWDKFIKYLLNEKTEVEEKDKKEIEEEKNNESENRKMGEAFFHTHTNKTLVFNSSWFNLTHNWTYRNLYPFKSKHSYHLYIFHRNILT